MSELNEYDFNKLYTMSSGLSSKPEQAGHGNPFVSFRTVFNNYFLPETLPDLMDTSDAEVETYSIKQGDIFLTRTSETIDELGISSVALKDYPNATFSGFVKRLRPIQNKTSYPKYLGFYLRSAYFRKTMTNNAIMTLRASLNENIFSYLKLYLPDFRTQKKIGDLLYSLDAKIELNKRINAELEAMAKTLYDYWFVQFEFPFPADVARAQGRPELAGKPYKSSGGRMVWSPELKRDIPEGWEVGTLSSIAETNPTLSISIGKSAKYIDMNALPVQGYMTELPEEKNFSGGMKFQNGDVLVARITPCLENGKTALVTLLDGNEIGFGSTEFIVIRGTSYKKCGFLACLARSERFRKHAIANMTGTSGRKRIEAKNIEGYQLAVPPDELIRSFELSVYASFERMTKNTKENAHLASLRDFLLPLLMNGQVTVE